MTITQKQFNSFLHTLRAPLKPFLSALSASISVAKPALTLDYRVVRLEASQGRLTVHAANGCDTLTIHRTSDGILPAFSVPADLLTGLVKAARKLKDRELELRLDGTSLTVPALGICLQVRLEPEAPPSVSEEAVLDLGAVPLGAFLAGLKATAPFASTDPSRPTLRCVALSRSNLVATDGFSIAVAPLAFLPPLPDYHEPLLLTPDSIKLVQAAFAGLDPEAPLEVQASGNCIHLYTRGVDLTVYRQMGNYPSWWKVVPPSSQLEAVFTVDGKAFKGAVESALTLANTRAYNLKVHLDGPSLSLALENPEGGAVSRGVCAVTSRAPVDLPDGVAFDGRMLRKLAALRSDTRRFERMAEAPGTWRLYADGVAIFAMPVRLVDTYRST